MSAKCDRCGRDIPAPRPGHAAGLVFEWPDGTSSTLCESCIHDVGDGAHWEHPDGPGNARPLVAAENDGAQDEPPPPLETLRAIYCTPPAALDAAREATAGPAGPEGAPEGAAGATAAPEAQTPAIGSESGGNGAVDAVLENPPMHAAPESELTTRVEAIQILSAGLATADRRTRSAHLMAIHVLAKKTAEHDRYLRRRRERAEAEQAGRAQPGHQD